MKKSFFLSTLIKLLTLFAVMSLGLACGGGSDSDSGSRNGLAESGLPYDFTGVWDVRYNLIKDECALVFDILVGVTDQQVIQQNGTGGSITGLAGLLTNDNVSFDELGNLLADNVLSGDVFGNGDSCDFSAATIYNLPDDDEQLTSKTLLDVAISCRSGFQCESQGVGVAVKQVAPPIETITEIEGMGSSESS